MTNNTRQSLRLFYALWPDHAVRAELMRLQAPLRGRKTRYENLHLTLPFLGQQPSDLLPLFTSILAGLSSSPVTLVVDRIGYFTQNKIAWAGMHETPASLLALNNSLVSALAQNNIALNHQSSFHPHITLARDAEAPEELPFQPFAWQGGHVALVESTNQSGGVVYRVLASRYLGQSEGWVEIGDLDSQKLITTDQYINTGTDYV
ncbi:MAG: RNA 2',3'-cyclic phosphodiesterase [Burkholderiaceae bacterium]